MRWRGVLVSLAAVPALAVAACGGSAGGGATAGTTQVVGTDGDETSATGSCPEPGTPPAEGLIVPNRGALGVELGQSRAEVIACLGRPYAKSPVSLSYTEPPTIFDLGFEGGRLADLNIAGPGFCLPEEICLEKRGNIERLREAYGEEVYVTEDEAGFKLLAMNGELGGRETVTRLFLHGTGGAINQVEIGWADR